MRYRFLDGGDVCLSIFGAIFDGGHLPIPDGAQILEIGCAEADWMTRMYDRRRDVTITGIDWRRADRPDTFIQGDVLTHDFPEAAFDVVVGVSSIEHIGLGHYQQDPIDPDGDRHCMERVVRWLKPGGIVYADVPYRPDAFYVHGTSHREYDDSALRLRLMVPGLTEIDRWYATHDTASAPTQTYHEPPNGQLAYVALIARRA